MICIKHCACPNCMAEYEREAYRSEYQRNLIYAKYNVVPQYVPINEWEGFHGIIGFVVGLAVILFIILEVI